MHNTDEKAANSLEDWESGLPERGNLLTSPGRAGLGQPEPGE